MSNKNILARDLTLQEKEAIHDKNAKHILQNKEILSRLLKETSDHFSEMSLEEIQESLGRKTELAVKLSNENHLPSQGKAEGEVRGGLHLGNAVTEAVNLIQKGYRSVDVLKMIAAKYELSDNAMSVLQSVVSLGS